jgi:hypothetical protein
MPFDRAAYMRHRRRMIAYGRWEPTDRVDPTPARLHLQNLRDFGLSVRTLGIMLGRDGAILATLVYPDHAKYAQTITRQTEQRILSLRFDLDAVRDGALVSNVGTARRIEALAHMGWSSEILAQRLGVGRAAVKSYRSQSPTSPRTHVTIETARAIRDLYDELSMTQGPATKAAQWARKRGWLPPLAWDDDSIDDPAATPHDLTPPKKKAGGQGRPAEDVVEDIEFLLGHHPHATSIELAERLGYADPSGVQNAIARACRDDLRAVLNRNAVLAGLNVTRRTA